MELNEDLKLAIEQAICEIFDCKIPLDCPYETTELVIQSIKEYLNEED